MAEQKDFLKSFRILYLVILVYVRRNSTKAFIALLILIIGFFLQSRFSVLKFGTNTIYEGMVGTFQEHDLPLEVTRLVSIGLVDVDETGRIKPALASSWQVNDDATDYKFSLKDKAVWVDGQPIKSSDLEFSIPNTTVSFPDDKTIEFKLNESYSAFPSLLVKPVFKKGSMIGTGPYMIKKIEKSRIFITKVVLETLDSNLPKIVVRFYPNDKTALTGFALNEIQSLLGISEIAIAASEELKNPLVKLKTRNDFTKIVGVFYNTQDPVLANRSLRQSLSFSAPLIEGQVEANNPYPPFFWVINPDIKDYLNKVDEAKVALERSKNAGNNELLSQELILTTTSQLENVGKQIISAWREIGIKAVLRVESGIPQKFQALLITQSIPSDPDQYFLWHGTQKETNLSKYDQKRVDKDLEDGRKLIKEDDRKQAYLDFQKVLLEDSPATFLYFPKYNILYTRKAESKLNQVLQLQFSALIRE